MSQFDYLLGQISSGTWLGKDFLKIHGTVFGAINNGESWFSSAAPVQAIISSVQALMSNPQAIMKNRGMIILHDVISSIKSISDTVKDCGLIFCETAYGINKAVNSRQHKDLAGVANQMLFSLPAQKSIYDAAIIAHNETLNLPELSKMSSKIPPVIGNPMAELKGMVVENLKELNKYKDELVKQVAEATGKVKAKAKRTLKKIESIIDEIINKEKEITRNSPSLRAKGPIAIIPPGGSATASGTIAVVSAITSFLIGIFTAGMLPGMMFEAVVKATTSIVLKFLGSNGAIAVRYLAASVFKGAIKSLPAIIGKTATFAGPWAVLMVFAPAIILAAVITGEAIKNKIKLGELLYIFGTTETQSSPDKGFVVLSNTNREEMALEIINMGKSIINETGKDYKVFVGIAVDRKSLEPVLAIDMEKIDEPIRYAKEEDLIRISAPWIQEILNANDPNSPPF